MKRYIASLLLCLSGCHQDHGLEVPYGVKPYVVNCPKLGLHTHVTALVDTSYTMFSRGGYFTVQLEEPVVMNGDKFATGTELTISGECYVGWEDK